MENTRIGKSEAVALIVTIMINHAILNITKTIVSNTGSSSLLNVLYISIIALIISYILYVLLNKFPTFDILDVSNFLGGKILKFIVSILFLAYFIVFSATLLKNFALCLQIIYYPSTNIFFIIIVFLIATVFVCNLKYDAVFRSNLITAPLVILSIITLFIGNSKDFVFENVFPVLGYGLNETFFAGLSNLFAFQGLLYILFLPPRLKDVTKLRRITITSILLSAFYLIISIATIVFMFDSNVTDKLLMPLYSAVRYINFGDFFQRLDSIFILTWIISFVSYLSIVVDTCCNILRKVSNVKSTKFATVLITFFMLIVALLFKNYAVSTFWSDVVYKYAFFVMLGLSFIILCLAYIVKIFKSKSFNYKAKSNSLNGGTA